MQTMSGFSQRAYNPHPDIPNTSPTYSQNSSRSKSQGYDALVAAQRNNADMGAVRKTSSGVGLSGIFKRNQSSEKKAFKGQAPARVQEDEKPAPKRRGPKPDSKPAMNRRQELNRQAQRTHRERKELYAKSLENNNLQLKEQLTNMTKQRDTFANEIGILKKLLQVNGIAYHASPLAIDTIAQNHTYGGVNPYTGNELSFATAPQPNGTIASQLNGYPAPASNYSSSIDTASLNNGMGAEVSPEMTSMSFNSTLSTNGSMSEGHTPQLSPATTADLPSSTIMAPSSSGNGYMNGYVYDSGNNFTTSSTDLGYSQAVASANTALMMTNGNSYNTGSLDRHIGQLEMQLGNHRQLYSSQTNGNLGFQNTSAVYGVPDFDLHQWSYNFVVALESSCSDHAEMMIKRGAAHDSTELSGHAMMMSCPPHSYIADSLVNPDMPYPHEIPNIPMQDFDVMVASNTTVDMNGEVNPFGALNMIRNDSRYSSFTPEELNNIKAKLQLKSRCYGFGAMLEEFEVVDAMDYTIAARYGPAAVAALRQEKYNSGRAPAVLKQQYNNSQMYNSGFSS